MNSEATLHTRTALERIRAIVQTLSRGEACNARTLADRFGVSTKTIHRDFDFLRHLGHELVYSQKHFTYRYAPPAAEDPAIPVAERIQTPEVAALLRAVDQALKDPRFWWEWEEDLKTARSAFPTPQIRK